MRVHSDPAPPAYGGSRLRRGEFLRNQSLTSASGRCTLQNAFKATTLYDNATGEALWVAPIRPDHGSQSSFALGLDGDLAVWNRYRVALWSSGTAGRGVEMLEVRDGGVVVLLDGGGGTVWTTGTQVGPAPGGGARPRPGRGGILGRGQTLRRQSLTSDDGSTVLFHSDRSIQLRDPAGQMAWSAAGQVDDTYLVLDEDGMLRIRAGDGCVVEELAGPGEELVVVRGRAQLRDAVGAVVWTTAGGGRPDDGPLAGPLEPAQSRLEVWIDSLTAGRGYSAAVVLNVEPAEALRRRGLPDSGVSRSTWERLRARRDAAGPGAGAVVGAVALGQHTLMLADAPRLPGGPLSAATTAVTSTRAPGGDNDAGESEWTMHRDGDTAAHLREEPPRRRKGVKLPEVARALTEMGSYNASWTAEFEGLELMCRVTGVSPTAADLGGELLGGVLAGPEPDEPDASAPEPPGVRSRPAISLPAGVSGGLPVVVVRTDSSDEAAWAGLLAALGRAEFTDVDVHTVSGPAWAGAGVEEVLAALPPDPPEAVFIADATAMTTDGYPVLAVSTTIPPPCDDYEPEDGVSREFRAEAGTVADMHINFEIGNMSFAEFSEWASDDPAGVFRNLG